MWRQRMIAPNVQQAPPIASVAGAPIRVASAPPAVAVYENVAAADALPATRLDNAIASEELVT